MEDEGCFTMNLRQSARRAIHESRAEYESSSAGFTSTPAGRGRKRVLEDASTGEDTPAKSGGVRRERVKRVKGEGSLVQRSDSVKQINKRRSSHSTRYTHDRHGNHPHFHPRRSSRLSKNFSDDEERGEERENEGEEEEEGGSVRRSKREKRLLFASFNLSEMNRQLLDPHHGFPMIDDSEDDLEPYEKLLSPRRTTHPGKRVGRTTSQLNQANKAGGGGGEGEGGVVKTEAEEGEERLEGEGEETEEAGEEGEESSEPDSDDEENSHSEDEGVRGVRGYFLRKRRPVIYQYQPVIQVVEDEPPAKKRRPRRGRPSFFNKASRSSAPRAYQPRKTLHHTSAAAARKKAAHQDSSTTSSGSDSDEARFRRRKSRSMQKARMQCLPMNFDPEDVSRGVIHDRVRIGSSLADVDPMNIDRMVTFESVGGLKHHVRALKEMIIFPLLYSEVFDRFKIQPPRGVLFYGPPGCGKTLLARALANECSKGGKKVAFFMRKGADCLSKWVGESERQLRLLFDQAYQMRPSIIFFDEIDGLAPVRSSRQDQIHSSIVSTLLALMDGLDSRGEIVVIGATNRIDAIDPALRRPGRFDREFLFPLPSREDRHSILTIHTKQWKPALRPDFIAELADATVGYCGADLRSLCTEASLHALRRQYPQIYQENDKLVLDVSKINVSAVDFHNALKAIVPTAQRSDASVACALADHVRPLLLSQFESLLSLMSFVFPPSWKSISKTRKALKTILISDGERREQLSTCIDEMGRENAETLHNKRVTHQALPVGTPSQTYLHKSLNNGVLATHSKTSTPLPGSKVDLSTPKLKAPKTHTVIHYQNGPRNQTNSELVLTKKTDSPSVSSVAVLNSVKGCKRTSSISHLRSALVSTDHDLCQLSQASQPAELDEVYFDTNDHETILEREESGAESILISETSQDCQEQGVPLASPATRFLMLSTNPHTTPLPYNPRLILCGLKGMGQTSHLGPALLHALEDLPIKTLDLSALFALSTKTPEEACLQVFREARRVAPSVVFIPRISSWWDVTTETFQAMFLSTLHSLPSSTAILMLATSECPWGELPAALREVFEGVSSKSFAVHPPSMEQRKLFFFPVLLTRPTQPPPPKPRPCSEVELETLPVAPPPEPRKLTEEELRKMDRQREAVLRELRVFLRDATNKLLAERKFKEFVNPVNSEEVPDYYDIIVEPMDLGTIMKKIDEHRYTTPRQWIAHVDLITRNALEYNPEHDSESRLLRHRAVALQDMAHSILDHELSEDFEKQCEDIEETYQRLGNPTPEERVPRKPSSIETSSLTVERPTMQDSATSPTSHTNMFLHDPPRRSLRQKGLQPIIEGLPYYTPPKSRTPRKLDEEVESREASPSVPNENGEDSEMEDSEEMLMSKSEEEVQKGGNSSRVVMSEKMNGSAVEQSGKPQTDEADGESVLAAEQEVQDMEESLKLHQSKPKSLKNAQVKRKILKEPSGAQQQANAQTPESDSLSVGRHTRRSLKSPQDSIDSSLEMFVRDEEGSMEGSPLATQQVSLQPSSSVDDTNMDEATPICARQDLVTIDQRKLLGLFERVVCETEDCSVEQMEDLYFTFEHLVFRHRMKKERSQLLEDLEMAVDLFVRSVNRN